MHASPPMNIPAFSSFYTSACKFTHPHKRDKTLNVLIWISVSTQSWRRTSNLNLQIENLNMWRSSAFVELWKTITITHPIRKAIKSQTFTSIKRKSVNRNGKRYGAAHRMLNLKDLKLVSRNMCCKLSTNCFRRCQHKTTFWILSYLCNVFVLPVSKEVLERYR